ncbi:MAG: response regulator [Telluria sp.]
MTDAQALLERVVLLTPNGRDAEVIERALAREGFRCESVTHVDALAKAIDDGAGVAVVTEEALASGDLASLLAWLKHQEPWSDFPFVVLVSQRVAQLEPGPNNWQGTLGNTVLLERPLNAATLKSATLSALRGRRRQYQARDIMASRSQALDSLGRSQAELLHLNDTLESRIRERTLALAQANDRLMNEGIERERVQQALLQFQKMEAIGQLTGGIAHDFNNLLNVIQGNMDLILLLSKDESARKRAEVARRTCVRGAKLTSQLLAFSRNQRLDLRPTDLHDMFEGVRELVMTTIGSSIALQFHIDRDCGMVMADANQLEMALLNLAINARDAMPGGGKLHLGATCTQPPNGLLPDGEYRLISVTDTGGGIDPAILSKVFDPFFTTKEVGKGTGLGLSQVYGMAQQSGGTARIVSEPQVGTTVEIWLRVASASDASTARANARGDEIVHGTAKILVVEDDNSVRQSMVEALEVLGYQVSQASDGEAGLLALQNERPHLMITDYLMPGMTGAQLIDMANTVAPGLPIIIATGYADMNAIEQVIGTNLVLRKPFQLQELAASVSRVLTR